MKILLKKYWTWARRTDDLGWRRPGIAVAPLLNGTADPRQLKEAEAYLSWLRARAVLRGLRAAVLLVGPAPVVVVGLDVLVTTVWGLL